MIVSPTRPGPARRSRDPAQGKLACVGDLFVASDRVVVESYVRGLDYFGSLVRWELADEGFLSGITNEPGAGWLSRIRLSMMYITMSL